MGASDEGVLEQRDTYFSVARGRLKLREERRTGTAELIYYERPALEGVRESRYLRAPVDPSVRELLAAAFGVAGVVEKTRRLFLYRNVRIHLDDVVGLGSFVELEAVQAEGGASDRDDALERVLDALGLRTRGLIGGGYLELSSRS